MIQEGIIMTKINGSTQTQETKKTKTEEKKKVVQPQDEFKDVRATKIISDRLSNGLKDHVNENGIFKDERGQTSVGHLAKSLIADENGKLNPEETKAAVVKMVANNPVLAAQAKELGVDLENPTWNDYQNCANIDIPAGQEIDVSSIQKGNLEKSDDQKVNTVDESTTQKAGDIGKNGETGNAGKNEETGDAGNTEKTGEAAPTEATQKAQEGQAQTDLGKIMEKISQAEQLLQSNPEQAKQLASEAKGLIANLRASKGIQQQNTIPNNGQQTQGQQVAQQIQSGANVDVAQVDQVMQSGDTDQIGQVLQALEGRCNKIMNGTANKTMNALDMLGQQNMAMNQISMNIIQIPYMNQAVA